MRGWVLLFLGLFLVLMLGAITVDLAPSMMHPGKEVDGGTFTGTAEQARLVPRPVRPGDRLRR